MKKKSILLNAFVALFLTVSAKITLAADFKKCDVAIDYSSDDYKKIQQANLSICNFNNLKSLTADEHFLLSKWGKEICESLFSTESDYSLQCRYKTLIDTKQLSTAETMALAGYTAQYYNYLNPENIAIKPKDSSYEGYDVFNRVLLSAVKKLSHDSYFQGNQISYRGTSLHGGIYKKGDVFTINRWYSSSCVTEIAFGPEIIHVSEAEEAAIRAKNPLEEGEPSDWLENLMYVRDPKSVPSQQNECQKIYYKENERPPLTAGSHFGTGNLSITLLPPIKGKSKKISLYSLSSRRSEAEILAPIGTKFVVVDFIPDDAPNNKTYKNVLILQELAD